MYGLFPFGLPGSGVKAFKCTFRGCDRQFARRYDMKKHAKVHQKESMMSGGDHDDYSSDEDSVDAGRYSSDSSSGYRMPKKYGGRSSTRGPYARRGSSTWASAPMDNYNYNVPSDVDAAYRMQAMRGGGAYTSAMPPRMAGGYENMMHTGAPLNMPDTSRSMRRAKPSDSRGYRVLHNSHVDLLTPNGVLECRESTVKVSERSVCRLPLRRSPLGPVLD